MVESVGRASFHLIHKTVFWLERSYLLTCTKCMTDIQANYLFQVRKLWTSATKSQKKANLSQLQNLFLPDSKSPDFCIFLICISWFLQVSENILNLLVTFQTLKKKRSCIDSGNNITCKLFCRIYISNTMYMKWIRHLFSTQIYPWNRRPKMQDRAQTFSRQESVSVLGQVDLSQSDSWDKPNWRRVLKYAITPQRHIWGVFSCPFCTIHAQSCYYWSNSKQNGPMSTVWNI